MPSAPFDLRIPIASLFATRSTQRLGSQVAEIEKRISGGDANFVIDTYEELDAARQELTHAEFAKLLRAHEAPAFIPAARFVTPPSEGPLGKRRTLNNIDRERAVDVRYSRDAKFLTDAKVHYPAAFDASDSALTNCDWLIAGIFYPPQVDGKKYYADRGWIYTPGPARRVAWEREAVFRPQDVLSEPKLAPQWLEVMSRVLEITNGHGSNTKLGRAHRAYHEMGRKLLLAQPLDEARFFLGDAKPSSTVSALRRLANACDVDIEKVTVRVHSTPHGYPDIILPLAQFDGIDKVYDQYHWNHLAYTAGTG